MSKMLSFSLSSQQNKTDNNVNNTTNVYVDRGIKAIYPDKKSPYEQPGEQYIDRELESTQINSDDTDNPVVVVKTIDNKTEELYLTIIKAFTDILRSDNKTLLTNLIDFSGKIILKAETLIQIIALVTNVDANKIVINFLDEDVGCLHKFNPLKKVASIKVDNKDMFIKFNDAYNLILNKYAISLDRVVVPQI